MAGWLSNGVPGLASATGAETISLDTNISSGSNPQTEALSLQQLALAISFYNTKLDETLVAGSRYYTSVNIGVPQTFTGIGVEIGTTGGTDKWIFELHGPTGLLLATTALAGVTTGTASTWQQIAFTATYNVTIPGTYWLAVQTNGTTATLATLNSPTSTLLTGSATGVFGTSASITPPTTYTANLGPKALLY